tara:strand:- start:20 stop:421 length:402 start_codon:yes stop_codon:yes gene_type:complete
MESLKDDLKKLNVKQLKNIISNSNIKNYSKLKKNELINLILANKTRIAKTGTKPELLKPKKPRASQPRASQPRASQPRDRTNQFNPFAEVDRLDFDSFQAGKISGADLANRRTWRRNNPGLAQAYQPMSDFYK